MSGDLVRPTASMRRGNLGIHSRLDSGPDEHIIQVVHTVP